jgi:beta-lactamase superfamily II metal-dependent hydrolase
MPAPASGVTVRMYRQGHGDCFLLAFRKDDGSPFYFLIDCGYKPGSQIHHEIQEVVDHIHESTGGKIDVVLITHEHQDHVNGFWVKVGANEIERFKDFEVKQLWLAWTEDPDDELANELREKFDDVLLGLLAAQAELAAAGGAQQAIAERMSAILELEGSNPQDPFAIAGEVNKRAIQFIKHKAGDTLYLNPFNTIHSLPGVEGVRIYAMGPPRSEELLLSLDPIGEEGFDHSLAERALTGAFLAAARDHGSEAFAVRAGEAVEAHQPFARRFRIPENERNASDHAEFFRTHLDGDEWRRIDHEWLRTAETIALRLNDEVNNTSLVIAIELPQSQRVLLFVADAQRGNWVSWDDGSWTDDDGLEVTTSDLLERTVFYKVGHHGSHNATLDGDADSEYPSLGWMAQGAFAEEFVAMIPANEVWANDVADWTHPLPSIRDALMAKAKGRVFQTNIDNIAKPPGMSQQAWNAFQNKIEENEMYFEYTVLDE